MNKLISQAIEEQVRKLALITSSIDEHENFDDEIQEALLIAKKHSNDAEDLTKLLNHLYFVKLVAKASLMARKPQKPTTYFSILDQFDIISNLVVRLKPVSSTVLEIGEDIREQIDDVLICNYRLDISKRRIFEDRLLDAKHLLNVWLSNPNKESDYIDDIERLIMGALITIDARDDILMLHSQYMRREVLDWANDATAEVTGYDDKATAERILAKAEEREKEKEEVTA